MEIIKATTTTVTIAGMDTIPTIAAEMAVIIPILQGVLDLLLLHHDPDHVIEVTPIVGTDDGIVTVTMEIMFARVIARLGNGHILGQGPVIERGIIRGREVDRPMDIMREGDDKIIHGNVIMEDVMAVAVVVEVVEGDTVEDGGVLVGPGVLVPM